MKLKGVLLGLLLMVIAPVMAEAVEQDSYEELFRIIRLDDQLRILPMHAYADFQRWIPHTVMIHKDNPVILGTMIQEAFAPGKMRLIFKREFIRLVSAEQAEQILEWLKSEAGQRITAQEYELNNPANVIIAREYKEKFDPARQIQINKIRSDLRHSYRYLERGMVYYAGMMIASSRCKGGKNRTFHKVLDGIRIDPTDVVEPYNLLMRRVIPYLYRGVSEEELRQYNIFRRSVAGEKFLAGVDQSFALVIKTAFLEMIEKLEMRNGLIRVADKR